MTKISTSQELVANIKEQCGEDIANDFEKMMDQVNQPRFSAIKNTFRDSTSVFIMACANSNILYKDLREAGLKLGIASVETFSRRIYEMRRAGLIYTESMHNKGPGRPKLKLRFNPNAFKEMFNVDPSTMLSSSHSEDKAVI
ncbi:hypothetical protein CUJ83_05940 [Methanocella sp. CWC-04]|uniref:Transcriptional regulator TbsP-like C-terminal domain-containing protein n=1 Tax=Methanooceanicella nereidis TaxID=2052831 RepID=A0AAP2RBJ0_9EURY|nr:DUF5821 family protein [Methanocella sp. CWC-04]MCD1294541.1 hypothetical protein [Methanocella sp. CWC-04]